MPGTLGRMSEKGHRKPYVPPTMERMNEKVKTVDGMPPPMPAVPGAPVGAQASPNVPGAKIF